MTDNRKKMVIESPVKTGFVQAGKYIFSHIAILFWSRNKSFLFQKISNQGKPLLQNC
jgi:hypothetical protein